MIKSSPSSAPRRAEVFDIPDEQVPTALLTVGTRGRWAERDLACVSAVVAGWGGGDGAARVRLSYDVPYIADRGRTADRTLILQLIE
jgi:hypothetical protein